MVVPPVPLSNSSMYLTADPAEWCLQLCMRACRDFDEAEKQVTEALTLAEKINGESNCHFGYEMESKMQS
jgi:hypothetical protein